MNITLNELRGLVRAIISENSVPIRTPESESQKTAFINLMKWAAEKMQVPKEILDSAILKSRNDDWKEAIEIVQDFYIMKGIKAKRVA